MSGWCRRLVFFMWFSRNEVSQRILRFLEKQGKNPACELGINTFNEKERDRFNDRVWALGGTTGVALQPGKSFCFPKHTFVQLLSHCRKKLAPEHIAAVSP